MRRLALSDILLHTCDLQIHLLHRANTLDLACSQMADFTLQTGCVGTQVYRRAGTTGLCFGLNKHDFSAGRHAIALQFEQTELLAEGGGLITQDTADEHSIEEHGKVLSAIHQGGRSIARHRGRHSQCQTSRSQVGSSHGLGGDLRARTEMVEQTAGRSIGRVDTAEESPGLGEQFTRRGRLHLREELTTMDGAEVREVTPVVQLLRDDGVASHLHEIETGGADDVTGGEEVVDLLADVRLALHGLLQGGGVGEVNLGGIGSELLHEGAANA